MANLHDVGRNRAGSRRRCVAVPFPWSSAVSTDMLFPLRLQNEAEGLGNSVGGLHVVHSEKGHDGSSPRPTRSPTCCGTRPKSRGKPVRRTGTAVSRTGPAVLRDSPTCLPVPAPRCLTPGRCPDVDLRRGPGVDRSTDLVTAPESAGAPHRRSDRRRIRAWSLGPDSLTTAFPASPVRMVPRSVRVPGQ